MIKVYHRKQDAVVAVMEVPNEKYHSAMAFALEIGENPKKMRVSQMVEKTHPKVAPSSPWYCGKVCCST